MVNFFIFFCSYLLFLIIYSPKNKMGIRNKSRNTKKVWIRFRLGLRIFNYSNTPRSCLVRMNKIVLQSLISVGANYRLHNKVAYNVERNILIQVHRGESEIYISSPRCANRLDWLPAYRSRESKNQLSNDTCHLYEKSLRSPLKLLYRRVFVISFSLKGATMSIKIETCDWQNT